MPRFADTPDVSMIRQVWRTTMTSQPEKHSQVPRRAVLGTALGGAAAAALPGTAHAEPHERPAAVRRRGQTPLETPRHDEHRRRLGRVPARPGPAVEPGCPPSGTRVRSSATGCSAAWSTRSRAPTGSGSPSSTAEVQDHRPQFGSGWGTCRLPVGHLTLEPVGTITAVDWRLSLWNAELTGTVTTTAGTLTLAALIHDEVLAVRGDGRAAASRSPGRSTPRRPSARGRSARPRPPATPPTRPGPPGPPPTAPSRSSSP